MKETRDRDICTESAGQRQRQGTYKGGQRQACRVKVDIYKIREIGGQKQEDRDRKATGRQRQESELKTETGGQLHRD
jgi:hypothetical protein